jgi:hypothetical protein
VPATVLSPAATLAQILETRVKAGRIPTVQTSSRTSRGSLTALNSRSQPSRATDPQQPGSAQTAPLAFGPPQQGAGNSGNPNQDGSAQTQAGQTIQSILGQRTTPTGSGSGQSGASGMGGSQPGMAGNQAGMVGGGAALGAGLAGVATMVEMEGIRRYKDHSNYSEWEFLYDPKDAKGQGMGTGNQQNGGFGNGNGGAPGVPFGGMQGGNPAPAAGSGFNIPKN